ncbi:protealysin inhibitor emfourin [Pantanalinema sp. GBBB05]|uniref:protealysin inhibitor emfourin n=1 Tax=Pantanalinema sp. GBBB05 TaxID=2604139 RepID=UPI001DEE99D9|nr:hypothetical protein [Pantanalinema sp. GBBB05]
MQISFERSGGFAGMVMATDVDTANLPSEDAKHLRTLVEAADFFRLPTTIAAAQPDRFQYQITVTDAGKVHSVSVDESVMPGTLRPLVDWLIQATRQR